MTVDEKIAVIARAILEIEQKAVRTWDNDGEDAYGAGLFLDESRKLREIAGGPARELTAPRTDIRISGCVFKGNNLDGSPVVSVAPDGTVCVTLLGWTCFGPDAAGFKALADYTSSIERADD